MNLSATGEMLAQRDAFGDALIELIDRDPRVYVLDGDLANSTKADKVSRERPDRFLEMGIAEQNMMGVAAGMATCGLVPWLSSFACFIVNRDLDQLRVVVAQPNLPVKLCGAYSGLLTGKTGKTHQEVADISVMRAMPNMTVLAPADAVEVRACMLVANDLPGPVYVRMTRDPEPVIFPANYEFELGRALTVREGTDITLISSRSPNPALSRRGRRIGARWHLGARPARADPQAARRRRHCRRSRADGLRSNGRRSHDHRRLGRRGRRSAR